MTSGELVLVIAPDTFVATALHGALTLSRRLGRPLRAVYVEDVRLFDLEGHAGVRRVGPLALPLEAELRAHAGAVREALAARAGGVPWRLDVVRGDPQRVRMEAAGRGEVLLLARHTRSPLGGRQSGPIPAAELAWKASGPVVILGDLVGPVVALVAPDGDGPAALLARRLAPHRVPVELRSVEQARQGWRSEHGILVIDAHDPIIAADPVIHALAARWRGTVVLVRSQKL